VCEELTQLNDFAGDYEIGQDLPETAEPSTGTTTWGAYVPGMTFLSPKTMLEKKQI